MKKRNNHVIVPSKVPWGHNPKRSGGTHTVILHPELKRRGKRKKKKKKKKNDLEHIPETIENVEESKELLIMQQLREAVSNSMSELKNSFEAKTRRLCHVEEAASPEHAPKHMFEAVEQATQQIEDLKHLDEDMKKMKTHHAELREHMKGLIGKDAEKHMSVEDKLAEMEGRALLAEKRLKEQSQHRHIANLEAILKLWTHRQRSAAFRTWCVNAHVHHHTKLHERVESVEQQQHRSDFSSSMKKDLKRYQKEENTSSIMKYCISMVEAVRFFYSSIYI